MLEKLLQQFPLFFPYDEGNKAGLRLRYSTSDNCWKIGYGNKVLKGSSSNSPLETAKKGLEVLKEMRPDLF